MHACSKLASICVYIHIAMFDGIDYFSSVVMGMHAVVNFLIHMHATVEA